MSMIASPSALRKLQGFFNDYYTQRQLTEEFTNFFEIFRKEGITLNLRMCHFLMTSVTFLGI
jgi:hypothetical protein